MGAFGHFLDRRTDLADRLHRAVGGPLNFGNLVGDFLGRLRGLVGKRFDLCGDDSKALACFTRPGRFDGRIQRQKVRLASDIVDQVYHFTDFFRRRIQRGYFVIGFFRFLDSALRNLPVIANNPGNFAA